MIKLQLNREPAWLELAEGVKVLAKPATSALIMAARVAALKEEGAERGAALLKHLAIAAILDWEGVGDDQGKAEVNAATVSALLDLWPISEAFERLYLLPAMLLEQEKNV